jgi:hypothetical protein
MADKPSWELWIEETLDLKPIEEEDMAASDGEVILLDDWDNAEEFESTGQDDTIGNIILSCIDFTICISDIAEAETGLANSLSPQEKSVTLDLLSQIKSFCDRNDIPQDKRLQYAVMITYKVTTDISQALMRFRKDNNLDSKDDDQT